MRIKIIPELPVIATLNPVGKYKYQLVIHRRLYDINSIRLSGRTILDLKSLDIDLLRKKKIYRHSIPITEQHKSKFISMYLNSL
jgi:hypothetical protein